MLDTIQAQGQVKFECVEAPFQEARSVWKALEDVFADGYATTDLAAEGATGLNTTQFGDAVVERLAVGA